MIPIKCPKCNSTKMTISISGPHQKCNCARCGAFVKFLTKSEYDYFSNQVLETNNNLF